MLDQLIGILAHLEEISLFSGRLHFPAAVGAFAVNQLRFRPERLTGRTVHAFIISFIDISLIVQLAEDLLHLFLMIVVRGTNELVIRSVQRIADPADFASHIVYKLLRRHALLLRFQLDLLAVLIRSRLKEHIIPVFSLKTGNAVRQHDLIAVPDMRRTGRIGDRRRDIILSLIHVTTCSFLSSFS